MFVCVEPCHSVIIILIGIMIQNCHVFHKLDKKIKQLPGLHARYAQLTAALGVAHAHAMHAHVPIQTHLPHDACYYQYTCAIII